MSFRVALVIFWASSMITNLRDMVVPRKWAMSITSMLYFFINTSVAFSRLTEFVFFIPFTKSELCLLIVGGDGVTGINNPLDNPLFDQLQSRLEGDKGFS